VISKTVLVISEGFGEGLDAARVAAAIARGLVADGSLEADLCPLDSGLDARTADPSAPLDEADFDLRMRAARAVVLVCAKLDDRTLAGSVAFEAATRARQSGVPAYAVTAHDALDPFEARIVDLQAILQAASSRALAAAGRKLAALV
jgi:glycerate 2-kinase